MIPLLKGVSSEGKSLRVFLTGFGPFGEVKDNPSATLVQELAATLSSHPEAPPVVHQQARGVRGPSELPKESRDSTLEKGPLDQPRGPHVAAPIELCGWEILEVSERAVTEAVPRIHSLLTARKSVEGGPVSGIKDASDLSAETPTYQKPVCLLIHFGVNIKSSHWKLESEGKNDARFPCDDTQGCRPVTREICCSMPFNARLRCPLPLEKIGSDLRQHGHPCSMSNDAGSFVCNYLYFKSLQESQKSGALALFVHVPPFADVSLEQQLKAALQLLELIGVACNAASP